MTYPGKLLKTEKLFAKKELGQNFLADPKTAEMIVRRAGISAEDLVLEIGAGLGALTVHAARQAGRVIAVEKDTRLVELLRSELESQGLSNVEIINADILKLDISALSGGKKLIALGNLPYNISSQVLFRLVEQRDVVKKAVLMFQMELADRITAPPGGRDYGRLSAVIQYCATITTVADIAPHLFFPKPAVDSRVIEVEFFDGGCIDLDQERFLFKVIKAAFSKRRKTLRNSLAGPELGITAAQAGQALETAGIDPARRAETLSVEDFKSLALSLARQGPQE